MNFEYMVAFLMGDTLQAAAIACRACQDLKVVSTQHYSTKPVKN